MNREEGYQLRLEKRIAQYARKLKKVFAEGKKAISDEIARLYAMNAAASDPSYAFRAQRLEAVMERIRSALFSLGQEEEAQLRIAWGEEYKRSVLEHLFFIEQEIAVAVTIPQINVAAVWAAVERPWEGRHFSKRIRLRTDLLAASMEDIITQSQTQGWSMQRTAKEIANRCDESWSNAVRLARTEMNRAAAQGQTMAYQANSDIIGEKEFCATLDDVTSKVCWKADGKRFPLDYDTPENPGKEGERIPNHPNCRSYWRPVIKSAVLDKLQRERSFKLGEQKGYTSARTYQEWAKEKGVVA